MEKSISAQPPANNNAGNGFAGTIPQIYDEIFGPFFLEPYAFDLVERINATNVTNILELAAGTGRVTIHLLSAFPDTVQITATDINPDMMAVGKQIVDASNLAWERVDMCSIPYEDDKFDLIVCQFGVMFAPDKIKALSEMYRVLKPGGQLLFNVWGDIEYNKVWNVTNKVVNSFFSDTPLTIYQGPFSMSDEKAVLALMKQAGFKSATAVPVNELGEIASADLAVKGYLEGLPIRNIIMEKGVAFFPQIQQSLKDAFVDAMGNNPMVSSLHVWVFEAIK